MTKKQVFGLILGEISVRVEEIKITIKMTNIRQKMEYAAKEREIEALEEITSALIKNVPEKEKNDKNVNCKIILGNFDDEEAHEKEKHLKYLKNKGAIKSYKLKKYEPDESEFGKRKTIEDHIDDIIYGENEYFPDHECVLLSAECKIYTDKVNEILKDLQEDKKSEYEPLKLTLNFNEKTREIKINDISITKPQFNSDNHNLFEFLYKNAGNVFTKNHLNGPPPKS